MSNDRYTLFLFWGGLFILLASLLALLAIVLVLPALAKDVDPPGVITEQDCQALIRDELRRMPAGGIRYTPTGEETVYPSWSFSGITGATRTFKWLRAEFDLIQVYFRRAGPEWEGELFDWDGQEMAYAWVAYAVSFTSGVHTPDDRYLASGGSSPFLLPRGAQGFQPGRYLVIVTAGGPYVTPQGFDCTHLEFSPFCQVEQSTLPGASGVFVENGFAAREPLNGFLFWAVQVKETLALCEQRDWHHGR